MTGARAKARSAVATTAPVFARALLDERTQRSETARAAPVRNIPSEIAVLLGEIERLQVALKAEQARAAALETSADTDPLTGLFNRRGFERELKRSLAYVQRYWTRAALFYVDLDGFKPVNDRNGHAAGDAVLQGIAAKLRANIRASDTVARLGGDEFGLILWNLSEADAASKAWALEALIAEATVVWEAETIGVGASIGFAMLAPSDELGEALARADHAMYQRKSARNSYRTLRR
jgi:diguanylate cyclase (GGDEF)-like protein